MHLKILTTSTKLLLVFAVLLLNSCKKEEVDSNNNNTNNPPGSTYYISCKVDGTLIEFKDQNTLLGVAGNAGQQHTLTVQGSVVNSVRSLTVQVYDSTAIETKGYVGLEMVNNVIVGVLIGYQDDNAMLYATQFANPQVAANVTELTATVCRGTFSGEVEDPSTGAKRSITEGQFYVKRLP